MRGVTECQGHTPAGAQGWEACGLGQAFRTPSRTRQRAHVPRLGKPGAYAEGARKAGYPLVPMQAGRGRRVALGSVPATRGRGLGRPPGMTPGTSRATRDRGTCRAAPLAARRAQRLRDAVSHGRRSGGGPGRCGPGEGRGPSQRRGVVILPACGAHRAATPRRCAGPRSERQADRGHPRALCRAHAAPNPALEPTPTASARASLRLLARLTASVRHEFHRSGKEVRQQQWSLAK